MSSNIPGASGLTRSSQPAASSSLQPVPSSINSSSSPQPSRQKVILVSEDGQRMQIGRHCLSMMGIFSTNEQILMNVTTGQEIPMPSIKSPTLERLIEWLEAHSKRLLKQQAQHQALHAQHDNETLGKDEVTQTADEDSQVESEFEEIIEMEQDFYLEGDTAQHQQTFSSPPFLGGENVEPGNFDHHASFEQTIWDNQELAVKLGPLSPWDKAFFDSLDLGTLIELTKVSAYCEGKGAKSFAFC